MPARSSRRLRKLFGERALHARATVTSFDPELLRAVRAVDASIPLALVTDRATPDPVAFARELGAALVVVHYKLATPTRIRAAHAAGLEVSAWTVNEREIVLRLRDAGIDSVITDYPSRFAALGAA
jgi:glycerophosphoryl diester phosphodiesterase